MMLKLLKNVIVNLKREEYYAILDDGNLTSHLNELISLSKLHRLFIARCKSSFCCQWWFKSVHTIFATSSEVKREGFFFAALTPTLRHLEA